MGAWIEIYKQEETGKPLLSRTPRWVRGLKSIQQYREIQRLGRTPRWVRGLKSISKL